MAGAPIPHPNLERRLRALEDRCLSLERERNSLQRIARIGRGRPVRFAVTYKNEEDDEYPQPPASVYPIRFVDLSADAWLAGDQDIAIDFRSADEQALAAMHDKRWILPGSTCVVTQTADRRWWIIEAPGLHYFARLKGQLTKGGSVAADVLHSSGTDTGYDLTAKDKFLNGSMTLANKTKVELRFEDGDYWVVNALCEADDT